MNYLTLRAAPYKLGAAIPLEILWQGMQNLGTGEILALEIQALKEFRYLQVLAD